MQQSEIANGHQVLDLGCGTGTFAVQIKQSVPEAKVVSIDGDTQVLSIAKEKIQKESAEVHFYGCFSSQLPFSDCTFDRVVSSLFFHHLMKDQKIVTAKEVFRVLKPGGQLHVADWGKPTNRLMRLLFYTIQILDGFANTTDNVKGLLPQIFQECGFGGARLNENFSTIYGTMALYSAIKP